MPLSCPQFLSSAEFVSGGYRAVPGEPDPLRDKMLVQDEIPRLIRLHRPSLRVDVDHPMAGDLPHILFAKLRQFPDTGSGISSADMLSTPVGMMHEAAAVCGPSLVQGLLRRVEREACVSGPRYAPVDDPAGVGVHDESDIDEARPGADVGEIRDPQHVRCRCPEDPVHMIERAQRRFVTDRGAHRLAADHALQARPAHRARQGAASQLMPFTLHCRQTLRTP